MSVDLGDYHVVGEVINNSPRDSMNFVKIISTFYDNTGKVVGTDFTYSNIEVIRPGEKSSFEIILNDATQSQKVDNYKLSASGDKTEAPPAALKLSVGDSSLDDAGAYHIVGEVTNQGSGSAMVIPLDIAQIRDQIRSQHPLFAAIADKIQTMDAKDTLKYTIGVDIVTNMLKLHAKQLMMNQTAAGNQTMSSNQTATP
jgi:hypothetical protein